MSLDDHLRDIARAPTLTCDEEIILGNSVQEMMRTLESSGFEGQILQSNIAAFVKELTPETRQIIRKGLKARNRMISANMRLVVTIVGRVKTTQTHMSTQDLIQEGAIGLARATEKFEPGRGYKFSTYAYWWIRQAIARASEHQEKTIRIPANIQKAVKQIAKTKAVLSLRLGKEPTMSEIASEMEEKLERVEKILLLDVAAGSFDHGLESDGEQGCSLKLIAADQEENARDREDSMVRVEFATRLINALPDEERELIKQKYGIGTDPMTIKEIAAANETSQQFIKQECERIMNKIKPVAKLFAVGDLF